VGITPQEVWAIFFSRERATPKDGRSQKKSHFRKLAWEDYTGVGGKSTSDGSKALPEGNVSSYSLGFLFFYLRKINN